MPLIDGYDPQALAAAADLLAQGSLVAFPTETVYGLGARADDDFAVARIYAAKGRPADHPLIVHVLDADAAGAFAEALSATARRLVDHFWPGPLTLIVPRAQGAARAAAGGQSSIGLRCPAHPVARGLLRSALRLGVPGIAAPSANRFGRLSPTSAAHVVAEFGGALPVVDGGDCALGIESTIVDCTGALPALLRPGTLARADIEALLGRLLAGRDAQSPRAPGTLAAHYAPRAALSLFDTTALRAALATRAADGTLTPLAVYSRSGFPAGHALMHRHMPGDAAATAHELFAVLRAFDDAGAQQIWVEAPPPDAAWEGVCDRLQRAAAA